MIDSAIDGAHPDLALRLAEARNLVDTRDGTGEDHGTAIAGIIAADAANAAGIVGVAPDADLIGLRACWQRPGQPGRRNSFSLARALNFAILNEMNVLNLSLGGPADPLLDELVRAAVDAGIVVVAAWGEAASPAFPASVPGVIAAGPVADSAIPAPSVDVISTAPDDQYRYYSGSSVAAAHVTGVVALLLADQRELSSGAVADALRAGLRPRDGRVLIDACEALRAIDASVPSCLR
ncbi:S8 family serine peptidase [Rhodovulum kholense]|uniref:Subtilase family protein n=1 Tax=Rhodovulum kholense TaxID=453584 RepID=A0A8E2VLW7_9RHOB|nr:S8 family serine peptidase [Rhodovulum kholense]PTW51401.1 subtilase family protein [Rhodovulum kholense]